MKNFIIFIILAFTFGFTSYSFYDYLKGPCDKTLRYSLGRFDTEFGIKVEDFKNYLLQSEKIWEEALQKQVFNYDPAASFKVNLIYDQRQQQTIQKQKIESGLLEVENVFKKLDIDFNQMNARYQSLAKAYEAKKASFEERQQIYQKKVNYWNAEGGAPKNEYQFLQREAQDLNFEIGILNSEVISLNNLAKELNALLEKRNNAASEYNRVAKGYNKKYGHGTEFDQAEYTGEEINIYQFGNKADLQLALSHEFGHALGMEHVENPFSVMYFVTQENTGATLKLSPEDLAELNRVCK